MRLDLRCRADEFARFKAGQYQAVVVEAARKDWSNGVDVKLKDVLVVMNGDSQSRLMFEVHKTVAYMGAATLEAAIQDARTRLGPANGHDPLYVAQNERDGFLPMLHEGIYAIMIKPYDKKYKKR